MSAEMPRMLDAELLEQLESRWRAAGATTLQRMAPGISDDEIDRIAAPLGFRLPEEARRLYRWHDGSGVYPIIWLRGMSCLEQAVSDSVDFEGFDDNWNSGWLHLMDEKPYVLLDCSGEEHAPVPVWHYSYDDEFPTRPVFASIGEMVEFWVALIDDGHMYWNGETWWGDEASVPAEALQRLRGVPTD